MTAPLDDTVLEELLGAYALDACDPEEVTAVEALLTRRPDLGREAARLADAAAWLGAAEVLEAPATLRDAVFDQTRRRAERGDDPALSAYEAEIARLACELDLLDPEDDGRPTANGLTARELVVHLAAQESLLARVVGHPVDDGIETVNVDERTAAFIARHGDRPYREILDQWRRAVDAVLAWANDPVHRDTEVPWLGLALPRDNILTARAFENWTHRDDLRRAGGRPTAPPPAPTLHRMADLSVRTLPMALTFSGHARHGRTARIVLTGDGGGDWLIPMELGSPSQDFDVTLTTDVLDWCLVAAERLDPRQLARRVDGDDALADDLIAAAPAFATL